MRLLVTIVVGAVLLTAFAWYRAQHPAHTPTLRPDPRTDGIVRSLQMLPAAFGIAAQFPSAVVVVAPILACIPAGLALLRHVAVEHRSRVAAATAPMLFLSLAVALWITAIGETVAVFGWLAWGGGVLVLVCAITTIRPSSDRVVGALIDGVGWYLVLAVVFYLSTGSESRIAELRPATTTIFGTRRVLWPLASSAQEPPIMAALYLVANAATRKLPHRTTGPMRVCFVAAAIGVWIFADDRFAVIAAIATVLAAKRFSPKRVRRTAVVCAVLLCIPWWWSSVTSVVSVVARDVTAISRTGNGADLLTLNNRSNVWAASRAVLERNFDRHVVIGYGLRGQRASGASAHYAKYFGSYADPQAASTHNSMLQLLLDQGLIGLVVEGTAIVLAFKALMRRAARRPDDIAGHGLLRLFGLLLAASAAEAVVSASFAQLPFWLLVVVLAMALTDDAPPERLVEIDAPADVRVA